VLASHIRFYLLQTHSPGHRTDTCVVARAEIKMEKEHIKMAMLRQEQTFRQQVNHVSPELPAHEVE
jgi:hypothetical protein